MESGARGKAYKFYVFIRRNKAQSSHKSPTRWDLQRQASQGIMFGNEMRQHECVITSNVALSLSSSSIFVVYLLLMKLLFEALFLSSS